MQALSRKFRTAGIALALSFGGATFGAAQPVAPPDPPRPASIPGHLAKAKQIAGHAPMASWVATQGYWCKAPAEGMKQAFMFARAPDSIPSEQLFDNFYYVGKAFVGSFILKTSDGLVVWDALDNPTEARTILVPQMQKLHLDPHAIKLLIITHGHFDHFGGAKYMQDTYHIPVGASAADWKLMAAYKADGTDAHPTPPKKDRVLTDGQKITVGDATITVVLTPGHTPGTISSIVPVKDRGVTRMMAMWGGTAYPRTMAALDQMGRSMQKFQKAAAAAHAVGLLDDHPRFFEITEKQAKRDPHGANPLVLGQEDTRKTIAVMAECLDGMKDWYKAMGRK